MSNDVSTAPRAVAITPSNTVDMDPCRAIYVGVTGNINAVMLNGTAVLFSNVPVGIFPIQCIRINSTSTTASAMVALY